MKQSLLLGLIIYALVLAGIATRSGVYLALSLPLLVYLGLALIYAPDPPNLEIKRTLSRERVSPGETVTVTLVITNRGASLPEVKIKDVAPPALQIVDGSAELLTFLEAGQTISLSYQLQAQRGLYRLSTVQVTARDPMGLFTRQSDVEAPAQFFVLPEVTKVRRIAIRPQRVGVYSGLIPARQGGPGVEFFGVREYQPGDSPRWLNPRAGARHQQTLFVNQFEQERMADIGLILDARMLSDIQRGSESLFEYSIQAAATLVDTFLGGGNRVGLLIYGRAIDWTFPGYGKVQQERILRALAKAEQGTGEVFEGLEHLPTWLFPARSQLVLISPMLPQDADILIKLRARGYRLLVISPNPVLFEQQTLETTEAVDLAAQIVTLERHLLLTKLRQAQIQVLDWTVTTPFYQVAHAALGRMPWQRLK